MVSEGPTRRSFLRVLAGETLCFVDELRGRPQMRLGDLADVPDHVLASMVPVLADDLRASEHGLVRGSQAERQVVRALAADELVVVAAFDGRTAVQDIADDVASALGLDDDDAFALVRAVFLDLAGDALARPGDAHDHLRRRMP